MARLTDVTKAFALLVGINDYGAYDRSRGANPGTSDLPAGRDDVRTMLRVCRALGIPDENIHVLTSPALEPGVLGEHRSLGYTGEATRAEMVAQIRWLAKALGSPDPKHRAGATLGLFTYSGHGDFQGDGPALCPCDVQVGAGSGAGADLENVLAFETIRDIVHGERHLGVDLTLLLDGGHAGAVGDGGGETSREPLTSLTRRPPPPPKPGVQPRSLMASRRDELARQILSALALEQTPGVRPHRPRECFFFRGLNEQVDPTWRGSLTVNPDYVVYQFMTEGTPIAPAVAVASLVSVNNAGNGFSAATEYWTLPGNLANAASIVAEAYLWVAESPNPGTPVPPNFNASGACTIYTMPTTSGWTNPTAPGVATMVYGAAASGVYAFGVGVFSNSSGLQWAWSQGVVASGDMPQTYVVSGPTASLSDTEPLQSNGQPYVWTYPNGNQIGMTLTGQCPTFYTNAGGAGITVPIKSGSVQLQGSPIMASYQGMTYLAVLATGNAIRVYSSNTGFLSGVATPAASPRGAYTTLALASYNSVPCMFTMSGGNVEYSAFSPVSFTTLCSGASNATSLAATSSADTLTVYVAWFDGTHIWYVSQGGTVTSKTQVTLPSGSTPTKGIALGWFNSTAYLAYVDTSGALWAAPLGSAPTFVEVMSSGVGAYTPALSPSASGSMLYLTATTTTGSMAMQYTSGSGTWTATTQSPPTPSPAPKNLGMTSVATSTASVTAGLLVLAYEDTSNNVNCGFAYA